MMKNNKVYIRPLCSEDITDKYISWFKDISVTKFLDAKNLSKEDVLKHLNEGIEKKSYYIFAICLYNSDLHIGNIKIGPLKRKDGISDLVTVIGDKNYWAQGIAKYAIKLAIDKGFNEAGIRKFSASINSLNTSSIKAYTGAGFKVDATIKNYFYNKVDNNILISDKIFVGIENKNFNMKIIQKWSPFL